MIGYIYKIENKITRQCYIGQTVDYNRRKATHINRLRRNAHDNPKLQNAWIKYGEPAFDFTFWEFQIETLEELNILECQYIEKYNSIKDGYNLIEGGGKPPLHKKVKDDDIITFLCVQEKFGDGYGKTCEQIFNWAKGTASAAKRKIRFIEANNLFEKMAPEEKQRRLNKFLQEYNLNDLALKRQLTQGGCQKAYQLTQDDYNFAFAAQSLGYSYTPIANYLGIKPATVKDWFNGRSRKKEKKQFNNLPDEEKNRLIGRVKTAELNGKPKSISSI